MDGNSRTDPYCDRVNEEILKNILATRDKYNRSVTAYIEVEADNPKNVLYVHDSLFWAWRIRFALMIVEQCRAGSKTAKELNLYYTGWNVAQRSLIGCLLAGNKYDAKNLQ